jgi:acyl-CoA synthetase (NDP forming)
MDTPEVMLPEGTLHEAVRRSEGQPALAAKARRADLQAFSRSAEDKRAARLPPEASQYLPVEATEDADLQAD